MKIILYISAIFTFLCLEVHDLFAQNNSCLLNGAYIVLDSGTVATPLYLVIDQSDSLGIVCLAKGGFISSEGQYNYVEWNAGANMTHYIYPFGVAGTAADYIPFTFNKTTAGTANIKVSTWGTNAQNQPYPGVSDVGSVTSVIGHPINRFWDIQPSAAVTADLTFSYLGSENTTTYLPDSFKMQEWSGTYWNNPVGTGAFGTATIGVKNGIGTVGPILGQTKFSPFVLTTDSCLLPFPAAIIGNTNVCQGSVNTYSVAAIAGATSYTWTLPSGWTGTSTTDSITATVDSSGGNITVTANNACSSTAPQTLAVSINIPSPGAIIGNDSVCAGSIDTFSIAAVVGATSYTWTLPAGWTGASTKDSIIVTPNAISGNITVTANNACGSSAPQTLAVTVNSVPSSSGIITGNITVCTGSVNTYIVTGVTGATSYTWTLPALWTGVSATDSIAATSISNSGNIAVTAHNSCGSASEFGLAVTVENGTPATPGVISGNTSVCSGSINTYSIQAVGGVGANSYLWTLPVGWTGNSTSDSIIATAPFTNASGNITVASKNACGSSAAQTLAVTVDSIPAMPGVISGNTPVCKGNVNTYSITAVAGATSYAWTLPSGWTGASTVNSISATSGVAGGTIFVIAKNLCGSSAPQSLSVITNSPPIPSAISGNNAVCKGSIVTYSVAAVAGATSYTWSLPAGWTGASITDSIVATTTATGGNVSVVANNNCGSSSVQTLVVSDSLPPAMPSAINGSATVCAYSTDTFSVVPVAGAASYTWTLPVGWTGASTSDSIGATVSKDNGGNISVIANNGCGSSAPQTLALSFDSLSIFFPTASQVNAYICSGSTDTLSIIPVSGAISYTWTVDPEFNGASITDTLIITDTGGNGDDFLIGVTANDAYCSSISYDFDVTVDPQPCGPPIVSAPEQACFNAIPVCKSVYVENTSYSGSGVDSMEIDSSNNCLGSEQNDVWYSFTVQTAGALNFIINPHDQNDDYDFAVFNLTNNSCADIGWDSALCISCNYSGDSGPTGCNGYSTFSSQDANGSAFNDTISVLPGQKFVLLINNFSGSLAGYTLDFTASTAKISGTTTANAGSDTLICPGQSTTLQATGPSTATYLWNPSVGLNNDTLENPVSTPTATTTYTLTTSSSSCPPAKDSVIVTVGAPSTFSAGRDTSVCPGKSITLNASGGTIYSWSPTTGLSNPNIASPVAMVTANTSYTVTVTNKCGTATDSMMVSVVQLPIAHTGKDTTITQGGSVILNASGGSDYIWNPITDLSNPAISNPVASPSLTTSYTVTVTNICGSAVDSTIITVMQCGEVFVPSAFSPNNDGENDFECIFGGLNGCIKTLSSFAIYDRLGNKVFETTDPTKCWDGMFKGEPMGTAVFVYYLEATLISGETINKKGNITLVR